MDDMFGFNFSDSPFSGSDNVFNFETEINEKNMDIAMEDIPPIKLEELDFDFEDMKDFGPWIETDVVANVEPEPCKPEPLSDRLNFKDLEIQEAVRYDCMWSSYNEFNQDIKKVKSINSSSSAAAAIPTSSSPGSLNLSNSFYDSLLNSFETPSCTESDSTSDRSSDMDTDEDTDIVHDKQQMYTNPKDIENSKINEQNSARLFASLDHCYNISSTHLIMENILTIPLVPSHLPCHQMKRTAIPHSKQTLNLKEKPRKNPSTNVLIFELNQVM